MTGIDEMKNVERVLMYKGEICIQLGRPSLGGKDNIKLQGLEGRCKVVNWTYLAQCSTVFELKVSVS
jgi:hypothetical protein